MTQTSIYSALLFSRSSSSSGVGTSSSLNYTVGSSNFWLKLQATDNLSLIAKDSINVTVSHCTPSMIFC
jgi:hypothetical protein